MENSKQPAFPSDANIKAQSEGNFSSKEFEGLTKREYFAAKAMQGLLASPERLRLTEVAEKSIKYADELLKQLSQ